MQTCKSCQVQIDRLQAAASLFDLRRTFAMGYKEAMSRATAIGPLCPACHKAWFEQKKRPPPSDGAILGGGQLGRGRDAPAAFPV